jgi:hypothetical protein
VLQNGVYDNVITSHNFSCFSSLTVSSVGVVIVIVVDKIIQIRSPFFQVPRILALYENEPILYLTLMLGVI